MKLNLFIIAVVLLLVLQPGCTTVPTNARVHHDQPMSATDYAVIGADVDVKPKAVRMDKPLYPILWSEARIPGTAVVAFIIDETGIPTQILCVEATNAAFAKSALETIKTWRFTPALKNGKPTARGVVQTIEFSFE